MDGSGIKCDWGSGYSVTKIPEKMQSNEAPTSAVHRLVIEVYSESSARFRFRSLSTATSVSFATNVYLYSPREPSG